MKLFKQINVRKPKRNLFDLSHERKFAMNMGDLVPILCEPIIPGDTWQINSEIMMRVAPMVAPIMHRVNVYTHYFFVPNRLVWDNWENFITGGPDGTDAPTHPYKIVTGADAGSLLDFLGYQRDIKTGASNHVNALPIRAYNLIYNEYYRDQNLQSEIPISKNNGVDGTNASILKRAWEKDYFTSALPWTQRGGDVELPLTGDAPVHADPFGQYGTGTQQILNASTFGTEPSQDLASDIDGDLSSTPRGDKLLLDPDGSLVADMSNVSSTTIEELRRASRLQEWLEKNARGGSRYIEQLLHHFGVISSDARLQRPEYLGGGKSPIIISEVLQTSSSDGTSPQGEMAGHGISVGKTHRAKNHFEEHGFVIGICSVVPKTTYQQGIRRELLKNDKFDYYWPEFAQLGEQDVKNAELFAEGVDDDDVFGYQSRYAEYKYIPSSVHGEMRTNLDFWHMGRKFGSKPVLNEHFIKSDPTHRIFADTSEDNNKLFVQVYNQIRAIRPIPKFNNPKL